MEQPSDLLTLNDAARLAGCNRVTIWRYAKAGKLDLVRISGRPFVLRAQVERLEVKRGRPKG